MAAIYTVPSTQSSNLAHSRTTILLHVIKIDSKITVLCRLHYPWVRRWRCFFVSLLFILYTYIRSTPSSIQSWNFISETELNENWNIISNQMCSLEHPNELTIFKELLRTLVDIIIFNIIKTAQILLNSENKSFKFIQETVT